MTGLSGGSKRCGGGADWLWFPRWWILGKFLSQWPILFAVPMLRDGGLGLDIAEVSCRTSISFLHVALTSFTFLQKDQRVRSSTGSAVKVDRGKGLFLQIQYGRQFRSANWNFFRATLVAQPHGGLLSSAVTVYSKR